MAHPLGELALLVPPRDAVAPAELAVLESALRDREVASHRTTLGKDPATTVRAELARGTRLLVHCGGQDSMLDVAAALLRDGRHEPADAVLGVFPGDRTNEFAMTFGLARAPEGAAEILTSDRLMHVDVGVATYGDTRRYVFNDAVVGVEARVYQLAARLRAGRLGGLASWWLSTATYRRRSTTVEMSTASWTGRAVQVRVANGQFAIDRLQVAPLALPDDGRWDVQVWDGPRHLPFTLQPQMLRGEHLPHEHVTEWRQSRVVVTSTRPTPVAIDGRYVGRTPVTFELLPKALRLKV
ncbi:MAG: diacylglycerol kinase family protein [Mycobacteriales bacterium]|nr:hypothetical protein [Frankia sp.]